jgi:hypothetical protein
MPTLAGLSIWTQRSTSRIRAISEIPLRCDADILAQLRKTLDPAAGARSTSVRDFKENPFDPRLRSHKIHKLSARYGRIIYAAEIEADLRVVFYIEGNLVITVDVGSHDIYRA